MLQRIAGNATQTTFEGYWVPIVVEGEDRIGTLCSQDRICFCPATSEDIRKITDPRTLARTDDAQTEPPAVVSRTMKPNYLAQQVSRRPLQPYSDFLAMLSRDRMVHVVTDSDARPNPGKAGWGALIRQNGFCTYNYWHYEYASNDAMEIRGVVEALCILPEQMHVWVSTDPAYVKKRITQWLSKWMKNNWKNSQGRPLRTSRCGRSLSVDAVSVGLWASI
jgi:hypothetical protein